MNWKGMVAGSFALLALAGTPALADALDGEWCSPDGSVNLLIDGPTIRTPGGAMLTGDYRRHEFTYVVPQGEAGAGATADIQQRNDELMLLRIGDGATETWHRCKPTA